MLGYFNYNSGYNNWLNSNKKLSGYQVKFTSEEIAKMEDKFKLNLEEWELADAWYAEDTEEQLYYLTHKYLQVDSQHNYLNFFKSNTSFTSITFDYHQFLTSFLAPHCKTF